MSKKLTEWLPAEVKPTRKGVYERKFSNSNSTSYSYWTGKRWMFSGSNPYMAAQHFGMPSRLVHTGWRGLAYDPEKGLPQ